MDVCWLQGLNSKDFATELGYLGCEEICHRDNICLLQRPHGSMSHPNLSASAGVQQSSTDRPNGSAPREESRRNGSPDRGTESIRALVAL